MLFIIVNIKLTFAATNIFPLDLKYIIIYLKVFKYSLGLKILKEVKFTQYNIISVTNTLRVGEATKQQNLMPREKTCARKAYNITKPFTNTQRIWRNKSVLTNIYTSKYSRNTGYIQ